MTKKEGATMFVDELHRRATLEVSERYEETRHAILPSYKKMTWDELPVERQVDRAGRTLAVLQGEDYHDFPAPEWVANVVHSVGVKYLDELRRKVALLYSREDCSL